MLNSRLAAIVCLIALAFPTSVVANERAWQTLGAIEFPKDTRVAFTEIRKTRLQRKAKIQSGELWLQGDDTLIMSIQKPRAELRKISANQLSLERRGKTRSITLDPARAAHQLPLMITNVLRGDVARLKLNFNIIAPDKTNAKTKADENTAPNTAWSWHLIPTEAALEQQLTALILSGEDNRLLSLRTERGSSYQEITILPDTATSNPQPANTQPANK